MSIVQLHRRRALRRRARRTVLGRHPFAAFGLVVLVALTPVWVSLGGALGNPGLGSSIPARFAEWAREHGAAPVANWAENVWYSHHQPKVGGRPAEGAIPAPPRSTTTIKRDGGRSRPAPRAAAAGPAPRQPADPR